MLFSTFLSSPGVMSTEPNDDKWFRTTHAYGEMVFTNGRRPTSIYTLDVPASPLACASQYQFGVLFDDLGAESLLARQTLNDGMQGLLPDDQWQREMTAWWAAALAGLQAFFVQTAAGVTFPGLEDYRGYEPFYSFEKDMCSNQASSITPYTP